MCGIAGVIGLPRHVAEPALGRMRNALDHRGPDDRDTVFVDSPLGHSSVGLAHTRLAIIDTSPAGRQPMRDDETRALITFNGEIYNFADVRQQLGSEGVALKGRTDTEVILRAYAAWGINGVTNLHGMFAFAVADPARGLVWLCRDRMGIKPLYIVRTPGGGLLFASEVRALLAAGGSLVRPRVSGAALESFLAQGMVCGPESIIDGVTALEPGTSIVFDWDGVERSRTAYWRLPVDNPPDAWRSRRDAVERIESTLAAAVRSHLIADVPLGLFLSSGIDSGVIASFATNATTRSSVRTLAVGFDQKEFDESSRAERIAAELGTKHQTILLTGDEMLRDIDEVFTAMDQPSVDGFNTYFVSRAARRAGLTVALSGIGGDELFGGYHTFRDVPRAVTAARMARTFLGTRIGTAFTRMAPPVRRRSLVKAFEAAGRSPTLHSLYLLRRELFLARERRNLHSLPSDSDGELGIPRRAAEALSRLRGRGDAVNAISALELSHYLRYMLLQDADVFSMASGLEIRVPLLDHRLVDLVTPLPGRWKINDGRAKPLLLDAVGRRLPASVERRKKRGFTFPWSGWLSGRLRERAARALSDRDVWRSLGIESEAPPQMWQRFLAGDGRVTALQVIGLWVLAEFAAKHALIPPT